VLALGVEEVLEDEIDIEVVQFGGRLETQVEEPVARLVGGERFELHQQRRHQIEGHLDAGKLAQQRHHAVVVLQRVQADPRQDVLPRDEVFVVRLVHVPQQGYLGHKV